MSSKSFVRKNVAKYFDGKTSKQYESYLKISGGYLVGRNDDNIKIFEWSLKGITCLSDNKANNEVSLGFNEDKNARLYISKEFFSEIASLIDQKSEKFKVDVNLKIISLLLILAPLFIYSLFLYLPKISDYLTAYVPYSWEESLGEYVYESFSDDRSCENKEAQKAIDRIVQKFTASIGYDREIEVIIKDSNLVNAAALPGGKIIFFSELIEKAKRPEEFVGVLAHEIIHITEKHSLRSAIRSIGLFVFIGIALGDTSETIATFGQSFINLSYSRDFEKEADSKAIELLLKHNIDPTVMADFFESISDESDKSYFEDYDFLEYLSTHPNTKNRIELSKRAGKNIKEFLPTMTEEEWQNLKKICE